MVSIAVVMAAATVIGVAAVRWLGSAERPFLVAAAEPALVDEPSGGADVTTAATEPAATTIPATPAGPAASAAPATTATAPVEALVRTSKLVTMRARRLVDTRPDGAFGIGERRTIAVPRSLGEPTAVVLSVTTLGAARPGAVFVDAGHGAVTAVTVGAGGSTTNLVVVPTAAGAPIAITHDAGGNLTIDLVGYFARASSSPDGRFVRTPTTSLAHLTTKVDGRDGIIDPRAIDGITTTDARAVLVLGTPSNPIAIQVRWPGGKTTTTDLPPGTREITVDVAGKVTLKK